jgi:hypothetical protein
MLAKKTMKDLLKTKPRISLKVKLYALLGILIMGAWLGYQVTKGVNEWFAKHELVFNKVISVEVKAPIEVKERQIQVQQVVNVINQVPEPKDLVTDAEKYIYEVFGIENYKLAISIAKAESGMVEGRIHINDNNTIDVGEFQLNSIHFTKEGCSLKEVATTKGNVDCAYKLYQASGWTPWVAFNNGNFISKLK